MEYTRAPRVIQHKCHRDMDMKKDFDYQNGTINTIHKSILEFSRNVMQHNYHVSYTQSYTVCK